MEKTFLYDFYVNYAKKDNDNFWVDRLQKIIQEAVGQLIGDSPKVLHYANQEKPTAATLSQVAVMICVVSPNFIEDLDCIEDLENFVESHSENTQHRIIKLVKQPLEYVKQPVLLQNLITHNLYTISIDTGEYSEITEFFGRDNEKIFWTQLLEVAQEVFKILDRERATSDMIRQIPAFFKGKTVFLAETTDDLQVERNLIKRELQKFGCLVLPDQAFPQNVTEIHHKISKYIEKSDLSIHLIGGMYGEILEGQDISLIDLQNSLAAEHSNMFEATAHTAFAQKKAFSRIIWIAPYAKMNSERQRVFVDNIRQNTDTLQSAEILQVPLEDLKQAIRRVLLEQNNSTETINDKKQENVGLYLIYDMVDSAEAKKIIDYLTNKGIKLLTPSFENNLLEARQKHIDNLVTCEAAIVLASKVSRQWVAMKLLDLLKAPGFGRQKPLKNKAVLTNTFFQPDDFIKNNKIQVLQFEEGVIYPELNDFLSILV
ncbi:MAG: DUF4062 domain-containing protein [Thermonemataceae bacterium]|nr:DUF4062 domain-containing protein [Thermonemataceae bacterium]